MTSLKTGNSYAFVSDNRRYAIDLLSLNPDQQRANIAVRAFDPPNVGKPTQEVKDIGNWDRRTVNVPGAYYTLNNLAMVTLKPHQQQCQVHIKLVTTPKPVTKFVKGSGGNVSFADSKAQYTLTVHEYNIDQQQAVITLQSDQPEPTLIALLAKEPSAYDIGARIPLNDEINIDLEDMVMSYGQAVLQARVNFPGNVSRRPQRVGLRPGDSHEFAFDSRRYFIDVLSLNPDTQKAIVAIREFDPARTERGTSGGTRTENEGQPLYPLRTETGNDRYAIHHPKQTSGPEPMPQPDPLPPPPPPVSPEDRPDAKDPFRKWPGDTETAKVCADLSQAIRDGDDVTAMLAIDWMASHDKRPVVPGRYHRHEAVAQGRTQVIQYMIKKNVRMNPRDVDGDMPLHTAAEHGHTEIIKILTEKGKVGADVRNLTNGYTPLHRAAEAGANNAIYALLEQGAHINAVSEGKATPLHLAAKEGKLATVRLLLEKGADPMLKYKRKTAYDWAQQRGFTKVVHTITQFNVPETP